MDAARQLVNSALPLGAPLPQHRDYQADGERRVREIVQGKRSVVSAVVWSPTAKTYVTAVSIPVTVGRDDHPALLVTALPTQRLLGLLREQTAPPQYRTALYRFSKIIVRTQPTGWVRDSEPPETWAPPLPSGMGEGISAAADLHGRPSIVAFARSKHLDWTAVVEVPLALLQEPRREAMRRILLSAGALLALGPAIAWWLRGRLDRSFGALRSAADAAEAGQRASEARFRHYWEHTPEGLFVVRVTPDGDFVFEGLNPAHEQATGLSSATIAGKRPEECLSAEAAASADSSIDAAPNSAFPSDTTMPWTFRAASATGRRASRRCSIRRRGA